MNAEAKKRLRELAGARVPLPEIAAVLRTEFKIAVTWEELDRYFGDEILVGRAYVMEKVSKKTVASALDGSATAQKVMFDVSRDADVREARHESAKGRRFKEIRLTIVKPGSSMVRGGPPVEYNQGNVAQLSAATDTPKRDKEAAPPGEQGPRGAEVEEHGPEGAHPGVGAGSPPAGEVQGGVWGSWEREEPLVRDDGGPGARPRR